MGEPTAITANQDDSNGTGNQNSVVDKDEVVHDGCPNEVGFIFAQSYPGIISK